MCIRDRYMGYTVKQKFDQKEENIRTRIAQNNAKMSTPSVPSTTCSSPTNDSFEKVIKNDTVRYRRKGYGLISAVLITFSFFCILPQFAKELWPTIRASSNPTSLYFFSNIILHTGLFTIANIGMLVIYKLKGRTSFFERYKISDKPWPWEKDPQKWKETIQKTLKSLYVAHFVIAPFMLVIHTILSPLPRMDLESFPTTGEIIKQVVFCMLVEDFLFYWLHRFLHWRKIYQYIHKRHHEFIEPVSVSAEYAHPIEFVLSNLIPTTAGPRILGTQMHQFTQWMWIAIRIFETVDGHSGYDFSWSPFRLLPLSGSATYHNFHHTNNVGNFGSFFTIWDTLMQTNSKYFKHLSRKQREENLNQIRMEYARAKEMLKQNPEAIQAKLNELQPELNPQKVD
eukprot:TRINITY_DN1564_c0_g4_i4.p1 TRINITY_DN1564_c0_g4~~TRINITY_DN1564_c0_g4_i4.p1  ORF type:complete len:420 (-),score=102.95 TRINITY_DN1564_c0_g4_i4:330-1520(-)